ncbi:MAG: hypothetical protein FJ207_01450 [Gemmatimonadetes bacterium]|nr:hypothetical protein [Gemmatimonadota bacterium]
MIRRMPTAVLLLLAAACGGGADEEVPADVIDRETFIATYVDLRRATIETPEFRIPAERREQILASHGVDEAGLLRFADAHGRDLDYMNELWTEVASRVEQREAAPPTPPMR